MTDSNASSALSSAASSPMADSSPRVVDASQQETIQEAMANLTLTLPPIEAVSEARQKAFHLGLAFGKTEHRWKLALAPFLKALKPKKTRAKKSSPESTETTPKKTKVAKSTPKSPGPVHFCAACSWNDPKKGFDPHADALAGKIPLDRKPCSKKGSIEFKDLDGKPIWVCATHAKPLTNACSRCVKAGIECSHHCHAYLQTGYFSADGKYIDGSCGALQREGLAKLAKLGFASRFTNID